MLNTLMIFLGTLVVVGLAAGWYGASRWTARTQELRAALDAARVPVRPVVVDFGELDGLPAPVQRFFRAVLKEGQPLVAGVRLQHTGLFNMGENTEQWKAFTSDQQVVPQRPGFDWDGRIGILPGLAVRVHDAYVAGHGSLHASVLGLYTVATLRGDVNMLVRINPNNHLPRLGLGGHAIAHGSLLGLRPAGWPGWADRTVTGRGCSRPLLGHGPSVQLATVRVADGR